MAIPIIAYLPSALAGQASPQSLFVSFTVFVSQWEVWLPIEITNPGTTSLSAGGIVYVYRSTDGGATYETELNIQAAFSKPPGGVSPTKQRKDIYLQPGQYAIAVMVGGGSVSTWSVASLTAWCITAYT